MAIDRKKTRANDDLHAEVEKILQNISSSEKLDDELMRAVKDAINGFAKSYQQNIVDKEAATN